MSMYHRSSEHITYLHRATKVQFRTLLAVGVEFGKGHKGKRHRHSDTGLELWPGGDTGHMVGLKTLDGILEALAGLACRPG